MQQLSYRGPHFLWPSPFVWGISLGRNYGSVLFSVWIRQINESTCVVAGSAETTCLCVCVRPCFLKDHAERKAHEIESITKFWSNPFDAAIERPSWMIRQVWRFSEHYGIDTMCINQSGSTISHCVAISMAGVAGNSGKSRLHCQEPAQMEIHVQVRNKWMQTTVAEVRI